MGSKKTDPMAAINEFIIEATKQLYGEGIRVMDIIKSQDPLSPTVGYSFYFREIAVVLHFENPDLYIDDVSVGHDVDGTLYDRLRDACAERFVMQSADDAAIERARAEAEAIRERRRGYGPLAKKLRRRLTVKPAPLVKKR